MKRPQEIAKDESNLSTIVNLTSAFEGLASMRIAQIKNQVVASQQFFSELWRMYTQIRIDELFHYGRQQNEKVINKDLLIAITAAGGFSGDIDERLIRDLLSAYDPVKQDLIIIGHHGAVQLMQAGMPYKKYFKLPEKDQNINVAPLAREVRQYQNAVVFYQSYVSLMNQVIKRIELAQAVKAAGQRVSEGGEVISELNYIFEPSAFAVAAHLERSMLDIALSQVILDSKLAQYASRFRAMSRAHRRSNDSLHDAHLMFNRAKRTQSDERLKEVINGLKKARAVA